MNTRFLLYAIVGGGLAYVALSDSSSGSGDFALGLNAHAALKTLCFANLVGLEGAPVDIKLKYCDCVATTQRERWAQKDLQEVLKAHATAYYAQLDNPRTSRRGLASYQGGEREPRLQIFLAEFALDRHFKDMKEPEAKFAEKIDYHWKEAQQNCLAKEEPGAAGKKAIKQQEF